MNIYESINKVMEGIGIIGKASKNQQQGFMYRGIDAVYNALQPELIRNKVFVVPEVIDQVREERQTAKGNTLLYSILTVRYTFYAEDGSFVQCTVIGEGMDSGDKASNKAMSVAFKYACFQTFCIPTEEMIDPDSEVHEVEKKTLDKKQVEYAMSLIQQNNVDMSKVLDRYNVDNLDDIPASCYNGLIKALKATRRQ